MMAPVLSSPYTDGRAVTTKDMKVISFSRIAEKDPREVARLLSAAENEGFFYLDLAGKESNGLWEKYMNCLSLMAQWFEKPTEEKAKFAYNSDTYGYKHLGAQAGPVENSKDGFETMRVAPTNIATSAAEPMPAAVTDNAELMADFINVSRFHVTTLLSAFSDAHELKGAARYENFHQDAAPSNSSLSFHRYPKCSTISTQNVGHNKHTDAGTLTVLFATQWGLQVQCPGKQGEEEWEWVRPMPGYAICNVGDSLRFLSSMKLRSIVHRVVPSADQEQGHRYSVGWFARPAHGTKFLDSEGRIIRSDEWFSQKFDVMRGTHAEQRGNTLLTGGMEDVAQRTKVEVSV
ncbi:hypothetical protein NLG97_g1359 [Lecanicillium saksenae]|uniref:Uncharacterized protein n=1 Tax=Lecanicillium saksenae TaxID=468837 RepID=A0ACC1R3Z8_9HYPO|nr:hypothetical protein NLG97_g1359 [Lecanicillium saksenae]